MINDLKIDEINQQNKIVQTKDNSVQMAPNPSPVKDTKGFDNSMAMAERRRKMEKKFGKGVSEGRHRMVGINEEDYRKKQAIINKVADKTCKFYFILGIPAPVPKFEEIKVFSPPFSKFVEFGEEGISRLTIPFTTTIDSLFFNSDNYYEIKNKFSIFDFFFGDDINMKKGAEQICGKDPFELMKETLELFCTGCEIQILGSASQLTNSGKKKLIIIPKDKSIKEGILFDHKFYNAIRPVIQDAVRASDAKRPRKDRGESEYVKQNNALMNQKERYDRKMKAVDLAGMINVVAHGGESFIPYHEIYKMNWFQFLASYETITEKIGYDSMIGYKLSANFQVKDEVKHWLPAASLQKKEENKKPVM